MRSGRMFALGAAVAMAVAACSSGGASPPPTPPVTQSGPPSAAGWVGAGPPPATGGPAPGSSTPNIIYILTDDLSSNIVKYMPHVLAMENAGVSFDNYFVTDSLCCPSRTSILTGQFPHNTKVYGNTEPQGGFEGFLRNGNPNETFAPGLQDRGYQTGFFGKFLNLYAPQVDFGGQQPWISPGWSAWNVPGSSGYNEFNYLMAVGHDLQHFGSRPQDYLTNVLADKAVRFVQDSARAKRPFMAEISTFATHSPYTPSPVDLHKYPDLTSPRPPGYGRTVSNAPAWLAGIPGLSAAAKHTMDRTFRLRVLAALAVDRMIGTLQAEVRRLGIADNTYFVFNSDNGFHLGEHNLRAGKMTAFDTDIKVPLVVTGPGVPAGVRISQLAQNIDLAPTFSELAGAPILPTVDGRSLVAQFHGKQPAGWRDAVLIEHHGPNLVPSDPDYQFSAAGNPPSYEAIRTPHSLYVEYGDGEREFYNLSRDPYELHNTYPTMTTRMRNRLHQTLERMSVCAGATDCWAAQHLAVQ